MSADPTLRELAALERAMLAKALTPDAELRNTARAQIGRVIEALDAETARLLAQTAALEPLDTAAALRVGRTWRQILPTALLLAEDLPRPSAEPEPATPPGLAARIAAEQDNDAQ